jgi:hypothetical protein
MVETAEKEALADAIKACAQSAAAYAESAAIISAEIQQLKVKQFAFEVAFCHAVTKIAPDRALDLIAAMRTGFRVTAPAETHKLMAEEHLNDLADRLETVRRRAKQEDTS